MGGLCTPEGRAVGAHLRLPCHWNCTYTYASTYQSHAERVHQFKVRKMRQVLEQKMWLPTHSYAHLEPSIHSSLTTLGPHIWLSACLPHRGAVGTDKEIKLVISVIYSPHQKQKRIARNMLKRYLGELRGPNQTSPVYFPLFPPPCNFFLAR